jgi:predicted amidohydrolase
MTKIAVVQMASTGQVGQNLQLTDQLVRRAVEEGARMVVLPEGFAVMPANPKDAVLVQEAPGKGRIQDFISRLAVSAGCWIVAGTIPIQSDDPKRYLARSIVFNNVGEQVGHYDKNHLFDVFVASSNEEYAESSYTQPGSEVVVVPTPFGRLGLSVCYDLRFPELFRELRAQNAEILCVPSAFAAATGCAHWRPLLRARAIENQCYVIAPNQGGVHESGRQTYGHSMIIGPWGKVLASCEIGMGHAMADVDMVRVEVLREEFPCWQHRSVK